MFFNSDHHTFFECTDCQTVFRDPRSFLDPQAEKDRYLTHINDVDDLRYQNFVAPIVNAVQANFDPSTKGLDFGAGTGPVITSLLSQEGYQMALYDPFFHPDRTVLESKYDFIVCCEVIEHFHQPIAEFKLLKKLLKPSGMLFCMTDPLTDKISFKEWYYKDDPTHVLFYSEVNLEYIAETVGYEKVSCDGRLISFEVY